MRKVLILSVILVTLLLSTGMASAHWRTHFSFGVFLPPLAILAPPPAVVVTPDSPPYGYGYYGPGYYGPRVRVPGYWEDRWSPYGWRRVWIPGYWR
jgi:hypothetical protein